MGFAAHHDRFLRRGSWTSEYTRIRHQLETLSNPVIQCVVLSFTDTHARVIIGDFKHGSTANNGRLYVQVVLNERLIISSDGSYDSKVYWRMLAWAFFRRMKKATRRSRKNGDEDGWISEDYDESGKWIDTET